MKIGFIGLGNMGASMALNLRKAGHAVVVHDIQSGAAAAHIAAGCVWAESVADVGRASDVVFTVLPGPQEVEAVALGADGLLESMRPGTAWFDHSTNSPTLMRTLHERFAQKEISVLDAPVSGGRKGAASGKLAIWVGGSKDVFDRYKPVLDAMGDQPLYIGPIGSGSIAKLVHQGAAYTIQAALAEVFTLGVKAGLEPLPLWNAVRQGVLGRSRTFDRLADSFLPGVYDPASFALRIAYKDVMLVTQLGREFNVPMRLTTLAQADMTESLNRGWGHRDARCPMLLQQERAGVSISVPKQEIEEALATSA